MKNIVHLRIKHPRSIVPEATAQSSIERYERTCCLSFALDFFVTFFIKKKSKKEKHSSAEKPCLHVIKNNRHYKIPDCLYLHFKLSAT
jgi:hypothetical protein